MKFPNVMKTLPGYTSGNASDAPERIYVWDYDLPEEGRYGIPTWTPFDPEPIYSIQYVRADLAQAAAPVRVKSLVWDDFSNDSFTAQSPFGDYVVELHDGDGWGMWTPDEGEMAPDAHCWHQTEASAKAAAQADYEARILAALEAPDAGVVAELVAALRACVASLERANTAEGVCCCGDDMERHSNPMDCGHSPVDMGEYYAGQALEAASAALAKLGVR